MRKRRHLQFTLRQSFVLLTVGAVLIAVLTHHSGLFLSKMRRQAADRRLVGAAENGDADSAAQAVAQGAS